MLRELRETQKTEDRESEFVFTQDGTTEPMHPQSPTRYMQKFSAKYGVPDMHPHKLRHTFKSIAITHGADIASVPLVEAGEYSSVVLLPHRSSFRFFL